MKDIFEELELIEDDNLDFNDPEDKPIPEEYYDIAQELFEFFQNIIDNEEKQLTEEFTSHSNLINHFNKHCLGKNTNKKSNKRNIYYDFIQINQYKKYEDKINENIQTSNIRIPTFLDVDLIKKSMKKFFEGNKNILFTTSCELKNKNGSIMLGLHSFSTDVTNNYQEGNTVDIIILTPTYKTLSLFSVDSYFLESNINRIIKIYSNLNTKLKFNH